ncbi:MAG: YwqG family protein [Polyangiaceae bacterium]|nr:YwqG family protein [Polyangiaceae bacterium]
MLKDIETLLRRVLPARGEGFELTLGPEGSPVTEMNGWIHAWLVLAIHEAGPERRIRDCKEQEVALCRAAQPGEEERVSAYLRAWARALPTIVRITCGEEIDQRLPCELVFPQGLDEPGARTEEDFVRLFESAEWLEQQLERADAEQFASELEHFGLEKYIKPMMALRRPSIRLVVDAEQYVDEEDTGWLFEEVEEDETPVGATKIGGLPDLPAGTSWPEIEGMALSFLAQIRLADLRGLPGAEDLPESGLLVFFHDEDGRTAVDAEGKWCAARHRGGTKVVHFEGDPATFVRTKPPAEERPRVFHPYPVLRCIHERMLPPMESPFYEALDDGPHDHRWYSRFARVAAMSEDDQERPIHRLLGYTSELQGNPYLQAHIESSGLNFEGWNPDGARERGLQREATGWRLLLQIDSTPGDLLNQDGGYLYFLIRAEDLAARRFDRVWGVAQGH